MDMPLVFMVLMGISVLVYVVLDGFDLGVGMLMPAASEHEQSVMVSSIGPFWDANETWLVLGVGILLAAFPAANGMVLTALYLPVVAMLVGLMLRGVAFELRIKALGWHRELWNWLFWFGSFVASFFQGVMLGRYVTGFEPGFGYWLFAALVGASLCGGYVLMGATWLIYKTEGGLQRKSIAWTRWGLLWVALGVVLVSLATPRFIAPVARHNQYPHATVAAGSTITHSVRGKSNHLSRTVWLTSGVPMLTSATPSATQSRPQRAHAIDLRRSSPSLLRMSQVAPSST